MKLKRIMAVMLMLALFLSIANSVNASEIIGEMTEEVSGMNQLTVCGAINDYFNSRESFLLYHVESIELLLNGDEDEHAHRTWYQNNGILYEASEIVIEDIVVGDEYADADVVETVTYVIDGVTKTETVSHRLLLGLSAINRVGVIYDGYYEAFSGFVSCSYVDEANTASVNAVGGSDNCIIYVAEGQVGYTEGPNNDNKYGAWIGVNNDGWCAAFVAWCAYHANIASSVIKYSASPSAIMEQFDSQGRYYSRSAAVGANAPQAGDIVFFIKDGQSASHMGVVWGVDSSYIYVVHGNNTAGQVDNTMEVNRANPWIEGYGKPAYVNAGHTYYDDTPVEDYGYNNTHHWIPCGNCNADGVKELHDMTYTRTSTKHKGSCSTCKYESGYLNHFSATYYSNATSHWKLCDDCGYKYGTETHTFEEVSAGGPYVCTSCGYESGNIIMGITVLDEG